MATNNLTTEQKARIFAMYLGCDIQGEYISMDIDTGIKISVPLMRKLVGVYQNGKMMLEGGLFDVSSPKLILRPLSAITDEDAIEVIGMISSEATKNAPNISHLINYLKNRIEDDCQKDYRVYQFLIQRGYAVPIYVSPGHQDNGKDPIQLGIAISKSETK